MTDPSDNPTHLVVPFPDFEERGSPEQLAGLYGALALAQGKFAAIVKDRHVTIRKKDGGEFSYDYAPLCNVIEATQGALSGAGLAVLQPPTRLLSDGDKAIVRTILAHKDGARLVFTMEIRGEGDIKDFGGRITYARRYQLQAVLGVDGGEADDDAAPTRSNEAGAQSAPKNRTPPAPSKPQREMPAKPPTRPQAVTQPKPPSQPPPPMDDLERKLSTPVVATGSMGPVGPDGDPGPEPPEDMEPRVETEEVPEDIRALDDQALSLAIRNAAVALKHTRDTAQKRCIEVCGKPREELARPDLERLLVAFREDISKAA